MTMLTQRLQLYHIRRQEQTSCWLGIALCTRRLVQARNDDKDYIIDLKISNWQLVTAQRYNGVNRIQLPRLKLSLNNSSQNTTFTIKTAKQLLTIIIRKAPATCFNSHFSDELGLLLSFLLGRESTCTSGTDFHRPDALPLSQPTVAKQWTELSTLTPIMEKSSTGFILSWSTS